ncbi:MAG: orotidine-5'-phosphate decarboxylase [bacterium]|jgi:orotidine-5'-phosphate decarboxylase|nr:orotidine-5'-phosphate decarboxylase [candidate division KSB1 bacterium]MDH7561222.1 orotidine-5'-phosphate decarboxylase [bacterium]
MATNFVQDLQQLAQEKDSLLCVGLDIEQERLPRHLGQGHAAMVDFGRAIIDATADLALAYKLNFAFFEAYGLDGWRALEQLRAAIPSDCLAIADAKRGDIGNTMRMYARAIFATLGFDATTASPYLGRDAVEPLLTDPSHGVFFLCLTSNPGARDFQYFSDGRKRLFEHTAATVASWNSAGNCGLVVGATHSEELAGVRTLAPALPFLIPGIGAQGGDLEMAVLYGTDARGELALFNSSRGIIFKSSGPDFAEAARSEAQALRDAINAARAPKRRPPA